MKYIVYIKTSFVGFHSWVNAPQEVWFLQNYHRHIFNVKVYFQVNHNDRDIEFFIAKNQIDKFIKENILTFSDVGSCEQIAEKILSSDSRIIKVEVNEDNENGAIVEL